MEGSTPRGAGSTEQGFASRAIAFESAYGWILLARHGEGGKGDHRQLEMWQGLKPDLFLGSVLRHD